MRFGPPPLGSSLTIGGQAVVEGVMMRSPRYLSVAVREPDGRLVVHSQPFPSLLLRRWLRLPVIRGIVVLYESLVLGARAIMLSASQAVTEGAAPTGRDVGIAMGLGLGLSITLFFLVPTLAIRVAEGVLGSALAQNLGEGALRVALVIGYIGLIGRIPDLRRVYQYHGAEHKAVNAFEAGVPLNVSEVRACSRFHPRCGTSFLLIVMLVAVVLYALLGHPSLGTRLLERVLLLPLVAGVSYEIIRLAGRSRIVRALVAPGIWLQHLTTREPEDAHLEVAIRALREVLEGETAVGAAPPVL